MKLLKKTSLVLAVLLLAVAPLSVRVAKADASANASKIVTEATGYTCAEDVEYVTKSGTVVNWGARGEDCTFLSYYAQDFYDVDEQYGVLSALNGGSGQSDAHKSELYSALQTVMKSNHSHINTYDETRNLYCATDCLKNDYSHISSFYSGKELSGKWDSAATWNREHCWPKSKCIDQSKKNDSADIMMLRPTWVQENSSRGNIAYGQSSGYFDPEVSTRGDCARLVLYGYVRWGNTQYMWGKSGVMESLTVLLQWMQEDPVDTWEMARNDSVQSITGTRNIFIDYPEYAWLLFGKDVPTTLTTPSGNAKNNQNSGSSNGSSDVSSDSSSGGSSDSSAVNPDACEHSFGEWAILKEATETGKGTKMRTCEHCQFVEFASIPALSTVTSTTTTVSCQSMSVIGTSVVSALTLLASVYILHRKNEN